MSIGKLQKFHVQTDDWELYIERLDQYFIINEIKDTHKVPTLITLVAPESYEILVTLCTPEKPATKSFQHLVTIMNNYLKAKCSPLLEDYKFRERYQLPDESLAEFKKIGSDCKFNINLDNNMRDQIACGPQNEFIRQLVLSCQNKSSFVKMYQLATSMDAAANNTMAVDSGGSCEQEKTSEWVRRLKQVSNESQEEGIVVAAGTSVRRSFNSVSTANVSVYQFSSTQSPHKTVRRCEASGGSHNSLAGESEIYTYQVYKKEEHLIKMFPRLRSVHAGLPTLNFADGESNESRVEIFEVNFNGFEINRYAPYTITINVNGKYLKMEVDTGSALSCINYECYKEYFSDLPILKSSLYMTYYTGDRIYPMGKIYVLVKYMENCIKLSLFIIQNGKSPLLGREWLHDLGIKLQDIRCSDEALERLCPIEIISRYKEMFEIGIGRFTGGAVSLPVRADAKPVFMRARPLAYAMRDKVSSELDRLESEGIITPVESSDWATPIVPVIQKDGSINICGDYKITLNKCLEIDRLPLLRLEDLLKQLRGGQKFSKIHLSQIHAQFELDEKSKNYTVIATHKGLYKYNRLIYGVSCRPGIVQRKLEQIFSVIPGVGIFLDDVIITGKDDKEHCKNLQKVMERLRFYGLRVQREKCMFLADSLTYWGLVIRNNGVFGTNERIEAIKNVLIPKNIKELRSFLDIVIYYAKFVKNISLILLPLYKLLKEEDTFLWTEDCTDAFNKVKDILTSFVVRAWYNPELPLILTIAASSSGIGAVISHRFPDGSERPVAYASRVFNAAEIHYSQIEREALSMIFGVKKFHQYLYGRKFLLCTDHKPLVSIFGDKKGIPTMAASRLQRWTVILSGYDYDIKYVPTNKNGADALSRLPTGTQRNGKKEITYLNYVQDFLPITYEHVIEEQKSDPVLRKILSYLQLGWPGFCTNLSLQPYFIRRNELYLESDCVMWGYRMVIPQSLHNKILQKLHVDHMGMVKMKSLARSYVWWPVIDVDIEKICRECDTCSAKAPPPSQPWQYHSEPWTRLHIDFLGPLQGIFFIIILDSYSKWIETISLKHLNIEEVIKVLREVFSRFGLPKQIVSNKRPSIKSAKFSYFIKSNGIDHIMTSDHSFTNSPVENDMKLCKRAITKALLDKRDIDFALQKYLFTYRNTIHCTTGKSPAELLLRRKLRSRLDIQQVPKADGPTKTNVKAARQKQVDNVCGVLRTLEIGDKV